MLKVYPRLLDSPFHLTLLFSHTLGEVSWSLSRAYPQSFPLPRPSDASGGRNHGFFILLTLD